MDNPTAAPGDGVLPTFVPECPINLEVSQIVPHHYTNRADTRMCANARKNPSLVPSELWSTDTPRRCRPSRPFNSRRPTPALRKPSKNEISPGSRPLIFELISTMSLSSETSLDTQTSNLKTSSALPSGGLNGWFKGKLMISSSKLTGRFHQLFVGFCSCMPTLSCRINLVFPSTRSNGGRSTQRGNLSIACHDRMMIPARKHGLVSVHYLCSGRGG